MHCRGFNTLGSTSYTILQLPTPLGATSEHRGHHPRCSEMPAHARSGAERVCYYTAPYLSRRGVSHDKFDPNVEHAAHL